MPVGILSGGGTGTYSLAGRFPGMTEIQAGSYLLMDTDYQKCYTDFELSLPVLTSVLSKTEGGAHCGGCRIEKPELRTRHPDGEGCAWTFHSQAETARGCDCQPPRLNLRDP